MTRVTRAQARRRRTFTALMSVSVLALLVILWPKGQTDQVAAPSRTAPAASTTGTQAPSSQPLPTWLAWMSGGFPSTFRDRIRGADGLTRTVVVAGDTRWMTASHDAGGDLVDQPTPPYMIPLDAFAVEPTEYAPFLPRDQRAAIVSALEKGEAVLGQTSSELRRLGPGGSLSFGDVTVPVGAVAPDDVVGWSEMLVNRDVGRRLGITDERYLLAFADPAMTLPHFTTDVRSLLPAGSYLRTVPPGGTRFVRVASGVNPPVVMKTVFGEFDAGSGKGGGGAAASASSSRLLAAISVARSASSRCLVAISPARDRTSRSAASSAAARASRSCSRTAARASSSWSRASSSWSRALSSWSRAASFPARSASARSRAVTPCTR